MVNVGKCHANGNSDERKIFFLNLNAPDVKRCGDFRDNFYDSKSSPSFRFNRNFSLCFTMNSRLINCFSILNFSPQSSARWRQIRVRKTFPVDEWVFRGLMHCVIVWLIQSSFPIQGLPQTVSGHQVISSASESSVKDFESDENVSWSWSWCFTV